VVEGARELGVIFSDGRQIEARLIGTFELTDLAVIQVDESVPAVVELGDSDGLQPGGRVIAIGSALGRFQNMVTTGIVSALNRQVGELMGLIQTLAPAPSSIWRSVASSMVRTPKLSALRSLEPGDSPTSR